MIIECRDCVYRLLCIECPVGFRHNNAACLSISKDIQSCKESDCDECSINSHCNGKAIAMNTNPKAYNGIDITKVDDEIVYKINSITLTELEFKKLCRLGWIDNPSYATNKKIEELIHKVLSENL